MDDGLSANKICVNCLTPVDATNSVSMRIRDAELRVCAECTRKAVATTRKYFHDRFPRTFGVLRAVAAISKVTR